MWVVFEGPDGTGKSTQTQLLKEELESHTGKEVLLTKEPGSLHDPVCGKIRELLLSPDNKLCKETAMLLFLADRAQHMAKVIVPAHREGKIIISDRSSLSTLFYHLAEAKGRNEIWPPYQQYKDLYRMLTFAQCQDFKLQQADICFVASGDYDWTRQAMIDRGGLDRIEQKADKIHLKIHGYFESLGRDSWDIRKLKQQRFFPMHLYSLPRIPEHNTNQVAEFVLQTVSKHLN